MEKTYEVSQSQFKSIVSYFRGYIFNRKGDGKFFVKAYSPKDQKLIEKFIN